MRELVGAACVVSVIACATSPHATFPSSQLAGPDCKPTRETLERVTYDRDKKVEAYAIGCAGCPEVVTEAQYQWLNTKYPGHSDLKQQKVVYYDPDYDRPSLALSCFVFYTANDPPPPPAVLIDAYGPHGSHRVCFFDSGVCHERSRRP